MWLTRPERCWSWQVSRARILLNDEKKEAEKMREVASRRKERWDISLIRARIKLLKKKEYLPKSFILFAKLSLSLVWIW